MDSLLRFPVWLLAAIICAGTIAACASVDATSTTFAGASHPPPSDPARVAILRTEPGKAHEQLGEIVVDASTDPAPPITDVEAKLRSEAAKMGADAVVIVLDRIQPTGLYVTGGWYNRSLDTVTGRKIVGVAIKYKS
jgi:hypothetical protein